MQEFLILFIAVRFRMPLFLLVKKKVLIYLEFNVGKKNGTVDKFFNSFVDGRLFVAVKTRIGFSKFEEFIGEFDGDIMFEIPKQFKNDFGVNAKNEAYYLAYCKSTKTVKCCDGEFFEYAFMNDATFFGDNPKVMFLEV